MHRCSSPPADSPPLQQGRGEAVGEIAFHSDRDGDVEIYTMRTDGSELRRLTYQPGLDSLPSWSPDGRRVAFHARSVRDRGSDIYVIGADGSGLTRLTEHPAQDEVAAWSPTGQRIAFLSDRDGNYELYSMHNDGTDVRFDA